MKYYIVGKTSEKGSTYEDSGDLNSYYELGWELMMTRVQVKKTKHIVNDISNCRNSSLKNHPLYMGDIFNYVKANIEIVPSYQNINFYKNILTNLLN
jgi:hypothetical protein